MNYNEVRQVQSISYHIYFTGSHKFIFLICRYRGFATQDGFENLRLRICLPLSCPLAIQNSSLRNPSFQVSNFPSRNRSLWQSKRLYNSSKLCHFAFELLTWQTRQRSSSGVSFTSQKSWKDGRNPHLKNLKRTSLPGLMHHHRCSRAEGICSYWVLILQIQLCNLHILFRLHQKCPTFTGCSCGSAVTPKKG